MGCKCSEISWIPGVFKTERDGIEKSIKGQLRNRQIMDDKKQQEPIPAPKYNENEEWVQEYIEQFGTEPSFF